MSVVRNGIVGLAIGVAGGILAGIILSAKKRTDTELDPAWADSGSPSGAWRGGFGSDSGHGLLPDEQITVRIKSDLQRKGNLGPRVNVTTIDGVVYLRGREADPLHADDIVAAAYAVPRVRDVVDEVKREA